MKKILVIEDEEPVRQNLVELLSAEGYQPLEAGDGELGLRIAWEMLPDLILCDITMPRLDGYGVLARISRDPQTAAIPFIFLTARSEWEDLRRGMSLGADDYIVKPFSIDDVLRAIQTRLEKRQLIEVQAEKKLAELSQSVRLALPGEMLSPLSVIISGSELLTSRRELGRLDASQLTTIGNEIHRAAGALMHSMQNYMLFTELEAAQSSPARLQAMRASQVPSSRAVIVEMAEFVASQENRAADVRVEAADAPLRISEMYLQRVVEELLEHALRSSPSGSPVVVSGEILAGQGQYALRVADQGRGIPADQVDALMGRFQPGSPAIEQAGPAMNLLILRRLVELHAGEFSVQSQPGRRTVVEIILPLAGAPPVW